MKTRLGTFLGMHKISPNSKEIEVECYGTHSPYQRQTLEQEGLSEHNELETVICDGTDITDYLSDDLFDLLYHKVNEL